MHAEHRAQGLVQEVGCCVELYDRLAVVSKTALEHPLSGGAGEVLVLLELRLELGAVDLLAALARDLLRHLPREAVGLKELECQCACEGWDLLDLLEPLAEHRVELVLLLGHGGEDRLALLRGNWVGVCVGVEH